MVSFAVGLGWCVKNCIKLRRAGRKLLHSVDSDGRHHYGHASDLWVHCEREYDTIVCLGVCLTVLLFRSYLRSGWSQNKLLRTVGMWLYGQMPFVLSRHGPWKSLNLCLKVLESAWIWFSKTPWPNQLILKKVFQMASFWPQMCIKSIFWLGLCPAHLVFIWLIHWLMDILCFSDCKIDAFCHLLIKLLCMYYVCTWYILYSSNVTCS